MIRLSESTCADMSFDRMGKSCIRTASRCGSSAGQGGKPPDWSETGVREGESMSVSGDVEARAVRRESFSRTMARSEIVLGGTGSSSALIKFCASNCPAEHRSLH